MNSTDQFEKDFFEELIRKNPNYVDALSALAEIYTAAGDYAAGLALDERLSNLCPADPVVFYNLACSYALVNRVSEALSALDEAVRLGYHDWKYAQRDTDLTVLSGQPRFLEILQKMRKEAAASQ